MQICLRLLSLLAILTLAACSSGPYGPVLPTDQEVAELAHEIRSLGPDVDPEEAQRAARIAFEYPYELSQEYQITDRPLVHNTKVNMGVKPRGLCWHWAMDMEARLKRERFETLQMHRAVANAHNIRLEHSTAIISAKGDPMQKGIVLDPWRKGGRLFWAHLRDDTRYKWVPRAQVLADKFGPERAQELLARVAD